MVIASTEGGLFSLSGILIYFYLFVFSGGYRGSFPPIACGNLIFILEGLKFNKEIPTHRKRKYQRGTTAFFNWLYNREENFQIASFYIDTNKP